MKNYQIAVVPGDGIGPEVVPVAIDLVDAVAVNHDFKIEWVPYPWGSSHFHQYGEMMPKDGLGELASHDAIFFGAVGDPDIPDHVTLWGLLIPIRRSFEQYVNLRPVRYLPGVPSPLVSAAGMDLVIVRENTEGEYSEVGGRVKRGLPQEAAIQEAIFTRDGIARVAAFAGDLAARRRKHVTSATKSNGIIHSMPFWDEVVTETINGFPDVALESMLIDAMSAAMVSRPQKFDVIVASNLFGDILSDLAAACSGSIGTAASGNINPERSMPSMFEPVHGTAPDIAGRGVANPMGQVYTAAMMLDFLGEHAAASELTDAADAVLRDGPRTPDLHGHATTVEVGEAVHAKLCSSPAQL